MNASGLAPIAPGLWTDEAEPRLIGGRKDNGEIVFQVPAGESGAVLDKVFLARRGTLWSWTSQEFQPKPPYEGTLPFRPYLVGYVELLGEVIVETLIVDTVIEDLKLGLPMEFAVVPFSETRSTFAFRPEPQQ